MTAPKNQAGPARGRTVASMIVVLAALTLSTAHNDQAAALGGPSTVRHPLAVDVGGQRGEGRRDGTGLSCANGGDGGHFHYGYEAPVPAGVLTAEPAAARLALDAHRDSGPASMPGRGWLQGDETTFVLGNRRGTVVLRLADGGSCDDASAEVDGTVVAASGQWHVARSSGSYRSATGSGAFTLDAGIGPGTDNAWRLVAQGHLDVLAPSLSAAVTRTYWGGLGTEFLARVVTVVVVVSNPGPGDAFGVQLVEATPDPGVTLLGGLPSQPIDLGAGEAFAVSLRYHLALIGPCALIVLACQFGVDTVTTGGDALDGPVTTRQRLSVRAPLLPPG